MKPSGRMDAARRARRALRAFGSDARQGGWNAAIDQRLRARTGIDSLAAAHTALARSTADFDQSASERMEALAERIADLERAASVATVMIWVEHATLADNPLISVVMPTRNRAGLLARAAASVLAQSHTELELVIVDDGSEDATPDVIDALEDPRVRRLRIRHSGLNAARNAGLAAAAGELIAYLDDDNVMHPNWLKTIAWAFAQRPEADVLYGAWVIDDPERLANDHEGELPRLFLREFNRGTLAGANPADASAIAHRAGLDGARFDERAAGLSDWDLLLRLTADKDPLVVPAIACYYTTDGPDRLSAGPAMTAGAEFVRERARALGDPHEVE